MKPSPRSLLIVDDDPFVLATLKTLLGKEFTVLAAASAEEAKLLLEQQPVAMVLADQRMPGWSGVQLLEWVGLQSPSTMRLLMTGLARLEDAIAAINSGRVHRFILKPWHNEELLQILRDTARTYQLETSHEQLLEDIRRLNRELEKRVRLRTRELEDANRQLQQKNAVLEKLALTDSLTGLPNRRAMDRLARRETLRQLRSPAPLTLGLIDVDHFKEVNSQYLLPGGDQVLIGLGRVLARSIRTADSIGRVGGEEFMLLAPHTEEKGARALAERVRRAVAEASFSYKDQAIRITVSVGVAVAEAGAQASYEQLKHTAAAALLQAKNSGRNCCFFHRIASGADGQEGGKA